MVVSFWPGATFSFCRFGNGPCGGVGHGRSVCSPFQSVPQLYHTAKSTNKITGISSHAGLRRGRRSRGSKICRSLRFPACGRVSRIAVTSRASAAICSCVGYVLGLCESSRNRSACAATTGLARPTFEAVPPTPPARMGSRAHVSDCG